MVAPLWLESPGILGRMDWDDSPVRKLYRLHAYISALEGCVETIHGASSLPAKRAYVSRKVFRDSRTIFRAEWIPNLVAYIRKWRALFRSFRGRIRIQFATKGGWVDVGPALQRRGEHLYPDGRTYARAEGIRTLQATRPWLDIADLQHFLTGFDEGERYGISLCRDQSNPDLSQTQTGQQDSSSVGLSGTGAS